MIDYSMPDVWQRLKETKKPIVLYGTGNGADKIIDEMQRRGIKIDGVFASDGFVRKRTFRDMPVMSKAEANERFGDFFAVICFASQRPEVLDAFYTLANEHETVAPDVPVYGTGLCDREWFIENESKIETVRDLLKDELSKRVFDGVLRYRYSGDIACLSDSATYPELEYALLDTDKYEVAADLGAYDGDTASELLCLNENLSITAFEPDARSYRKLVARFDGVPNVKSLNIAAWKEKCTLEFADSQGRGSSASKGGKTVSVEADSVDNVFAGRKVDYIKYDVEGNEHEALLGSHETIKRHSPDLCISLYHRVGDIIDIPLYIRCLYPDYTFFMRRIPYVPAWDLKLYAIRH